MQWGKNVEALQQVRDSGLPVPALDNAPPHRPELDLFLRCFLDVSSDRSFDGHITFASVAQWCAAFGVPLEECWAVVRRADDEVRRWQSQSKR
jgi:hypothetical protein